NSEGGTHDTRFCYIGENRLRLLESQLPADVSILGVDEHTVCIIDAIEGSVTVRGQGALTWRHQGIERQWRATSLPLSEIQHGQAAIHNAITEPPPTKRVNLDRNDAERVAASILELERSLYGEARALNSGNGLQMRSEMRYLVVRLAELAREGGDVRELLAPLVDMLVALRNEAREEQRFDEADRLRGVLLRSGVEVQDSPTGTAWSLVHA
ncbi:MAG TPA: hypothetical protein VLS53_00540, partial [Candidatus Dormibacteraeota bacterium]|nr:hypothetical protein [Candidatus Dormibacteraeota bacterium]